jgi:subtilisin family serine protease
MTTKKSKSKKAASKSASTKSKASKSPLPAKIYANVSPHSVGGVSMFEAQHQIQAETVHNFFSDGDVVNAAVARLQEAGFEILQISPLTINIAGTATQYRKAFGTNIVVEDRPVIKEGAKKDVAQFLDSPDTSLSGLIQTQGTAFEDTIEGVALEEPRYFMAPSMYAPLKSYWHLRLPGDVSLALNADKAHRAGITGKGIKVAMCDTGWFKHPYFVGRGYNAAPVVLGPAAALPLKDEVGHGTGESANIFAAAPDVSFLPVKMNFVNSTGAFNAAVGLGPDIITCSWGSHHPSGPLSAADQVLAAAIAAAVASGIVVVFSAGNGHYGFPGMHPDVISAGGVFMNSDESLQASNYASAYPGNVYPGRHCPDLCGLVGMKPKAIYIMFPLEPGDQIDVDNAGGTFPNGDETTNSDGWAAFSGTSAAAPQLAGVAALIKQACPKLTPVQVRNIMKSTARDVTAGTSNAVQGTPVFPAGYPAGVGPDMATGTGLVDAHKAVMLAKVQCLPIIGPPIIVTPIVPPIVQPVQPPVQPITGPIKPITGPVLPITPVTPVQPITGPIKPITPVQPVTPVTPVQPITGPITPITPVQPVKPIQPGPVIPIQPIKPIAPIVNPGPVKPAAGEMEGLSEAAGGSGLSASDVEKLSELIINSELDIE